MGQLRSLLYVGFIVAVVVGWYTNRRKGSGTAQHPQSKSLLKMPESINDALNHSTWMIRLQALQTLLEDPTTNIIDTLLKMLADPIPDIRSLASAELVAYGEEALEGLNEILDTNNLSARESVIQTLVAMHSSVTIPLLVKALLHDESAWVRTPAAEGLGAIGGEEASGALIRALGDTHPEVLKAVRQALQSIGSPEALKAIQA